MKCQLDDETLYELADGRLSGPERDSVNHHLSACHACQERLQEFKQLIAMLSAAGDDPSPEEAEALWQDIVSALDTSDSTNIAHRLAGAVFARKVETASALVEKHLSRIANLAPEDEGGAALLHYFAQWLNMGFAFRGTETGCSHLDLLRSTLRRFPRRPRPAQPILECAHLTMIEGTLDLYDERYDGAIAAFEFVVAVRAQIGDDRLVTLACAALSKAHCRRAEYAPARLWIDRAIRLARKLRLTKVAALFETKRAWILFQTRRGSEARHRLEDARRALEPIGDYQTLADISAGLGRIARRRGEYGTSRSCYERSLYEYSHVDAGHTNRARALVNLAMVERLVACRMVASGASASAVDETRHTARTLLDEARRIYSTHRDYRGRGAVLLVEAWLHLDTGKLDQAAQAAATAYELGVENKDILLQARARVQQCRVAYASAEGMGCGGDASAHLERAHSLACQAVELADRTEDLRLRAASRIWLGMALVSPYFGRRKAMAVYKQAKKNLDPETRDYLREELDRLKRKLKQASNAEDERTRTEREETSHGEHARQSSDISSRFTRA